MPSRPSKKPADIRSLARSYTELAIRTLAGIMQHSENDNARVNAAALMLERGHGRAPLIDNDAELRVVIRTIVTPIGEHAPKILDHQASPDSNLD